MLPIGILIVFVLPLVLTSPRPSNDACDVDDTHRFDCFPDSLATEKDCIARGCCWRQASGVSNAELNVPYCYYGKGNFGYEVCGRTNTTAGFVLDLCLKGPGGPYGDNLEKLKAEFRIETDNRLRVKILDANVKRYEVPLPTPEVNQKASSPNYQITYTSFPFGFAVTRLPNGRTIFNSSVGAFIYSNQFLQMSSYLPSNNIYGLGEHVLGLKLSTKWNQLTLFSRDIADPEGGGNLYGVHPFYVNVEDDGKANGVFLKNSNAMDIILQPTPAITYRTIGGILDYYIFLGPTPNNVVMQLSEVVGKTTMPPYWSLGFHLCRYGYNTIEHMEEVRERMAVNKIPQDTQWNDIDYMQSYRDFTVDNVKYKGLPEFVDKLHSEGMHYILMTDPAISTTTGYEPYDDGVENNIFIKDDKDKILVGKVWPGDTAFPDFFNPNTSIYWHKHISNFHELIKFDGLWIDMNEPSNFVQGSIDGCPSNTMEHPPYVPHIYGGLLSDKTICMSAKQYNGVHYDLHSLYGYSESVQTMNALKKVLGKRSMVITRSTFTGTGKHAGHWLGDNHSTWDDLYLSIAGLLNFNMFGIPIAGSDICGFLGDTNEELCSRWMQLGAFYPFSRNHNTLGARDQDPAAFGQQLITASKTALNVRYTLLPYLYTLFYFSHTSGSTVARPLFFEFPNDSQTYGIDAQFMWGSGLLISPVVTQGASSVSAYLPQGRWYEYYSGTSIDSNGEYLTLPAAFDKVNLHIRGGNILPTQDPAITTTKSRQNDFGLIIALDEKEKANGDFYLDDGDQLLDEGVTATTLLNLDCRGGKFQSVSTRKGYTPKFKTLNHVTIFGVTKSPSKVLVNGASMQFDYNTTTKVLSLRQLQLSVTEQNSIDWSDDEINMFPKTLLV